jgi:hypothetical protein
MIESILYIGTAISAIGLLCVIASLGAENDRLDSELNRSFDRLWEKYKRPGYNKSGKQCGTCVHWNRDPSFNEYLLKDRFMCLNSSSAHSFRRTKFTKGKKCGVYEVKV